MSAETAALLSRGHAAAAAQDWDEARHHLEWLLRLDADPHERVEAHYWLSQICTDPAEKRDHLHEVLAAERRAEPVAVLALAAG